MDIAQTQAVINILTGLVCISAVLHSLAKIRKNLHSWHVFLYLMACALAGWAAGSYAYVVFVDEGANIALIRWVISGWHVFATLVVLARIIISETAADVATVKELLTGRKECQEEIAALKIRMADTETSLNIYREVSDLKSKEIARLKEEVAELKEQLRRATGGFIQHGGQP